MSFPTFRCTSKRRKIKLNPLQHIFYVIVLYNDRQEPEEGKEAKEGIEKETEEEEGEAI